MITSTQNRATIGKAIVLGFLLATLIAILLSAAAPAGATVSSGKAFSWGFNSDGQLGNGTSGDGTDTNIPGAVKDFTGVKSVKAGGGHGLALKTNGTVYAWGYGGSGELGNGAFDSSEVPVKVKIDNVKAISAGYEHNLALLRSGKVKSWGYNYDGELGNATHGPNTNRSTPGNVVGLTNVRFISGGLDHSLAVLESGAARSWGDNYDGQLGKGTDGDGTDSDVPVAVKNLSNVENIDGGAWFTLAATQ